MINYKALFSGIALVVMGMVGGQAILVGQGVSQLSTSYEIEPPKTQK